MLDGPVSTMLRPRIIVKSILIASVITHPVFGIDYQGEINAIPQHMEQEWVNRYFNSIDEDTPLEEVVDFLVSLKGSFTAKGYKTPSLTELCLTLREDLIKKGIEIDDEAIELVYNEVEKREATLIQTTNFKQAIAHRPLHIDLVKHKDKKGGKVNGKTVFGFVKILTGALLCIVPVPAVQVVGAGLALNGVNDCIDGAREQGEENERNQKAQEGAPPNMPADYHNELLDKQK